MSNVVQRSFAGGELAPILHQRTDLVKYATGVRKARNVVIQKQGGIENRAGSVYVGETKSNVGVRLLPFIFNESQTYVLEFGPNYVRFVQDGGYLVVSGVSAWVVTTAYSIGDLVSRGGTNYYCKKAHTSSAGDEPGVGTGWATYWHALSGTRFEIPSPYGADDLSTLRIVQSADTITIVHPSHEIHELVRFGHTDWTLTPKTLAAGISAPSGLALAGGGAGSLLYWAVTAIDEETGEESDAGVISQAGVVPSSATPTVLSWNPVAGAREFFIYRSIDGNTYGFIGTSGGATVEREDNTWTTPTANASGLPGDWRASASQARNPVVAAASEKSYDESYRVTGSLQLNFVSGGTGRARLRAYYSRDGEVRVDAGIIASIPETSGAALEYVLIAIDTRITVPDNGYTTLTIDLVPEVWPDVDETADVNGTSIFVPEAAGTFSDEGTNPDYTSFPPMFPSIFDSVDNYPSAVGYYQQRQCFANTNNEPQRVRASRTGSFGNFSVSAPMTNDSAVSFELAGRRLSDVKFIVDLDRLLLFTSQGEWVVKGDADGIMLPGAVNPRQVGYVGVGDLSPIIVGRRVIFVQARSNGIFDIVRSNFDDYDTRDLSIFASHLFRGYTLVDMDYAQTPNSTVVLVRSDGKMLLLTYVPEHEVWGWSWFDTDGVVENVCCVPESNEDRIYVVVRRTINGATKRYLERLASRTVTESTLTKDMIFMDSALTYEGAAATVIGGLSHLEGKEVSVLADGVVVSSPNNSQLGLPTLTVTAGSITIPTAASTVHVGLPYISDVETLDIDTVQGPSKKPQRINVSRVGIGLDETRGLFVGPALPTGADEVENMSEVEFLTAASDTAVTRYTQYVETEVHSTWDFAGKLAFRQVDPLPFALLSVTAIGPTTG